jgi:hypothetical protein
MACRQQIKIDMETNFRGMLFGAKILVETDSDHTYRECQKWFEAMDTRCWQAGEEKVKSDVAKIASLK